MQQYFSSSTAPSQLTRPVDAAAEQRGGQAQAEHRSRDQSALSLLQSQFEQLPIVTFCASIDQLLGGGVALGSMTEIGAYLLGAFGGLLMCCSGLSRNRQNANGDATSCRHHYSSCLWWSRRVRPYHRYVINLTPMYVLKDPRH